MRRRTVLAAGWAWLALPGAGTSAVSELEFRVLRNGREIGRHRLLFERRGEELRCTIAVELRVGLGPVTLHRYRHDNRESWHAGRFVGFESRTDDNGTKLAVRAERTDRGIEVEGAEGAYLAPADAWPTTYWYPGFLDREAWVDTQFGRLRRARVVPAGETRVPVGSRTVPARRYRLEGDLALELRYRERHWVGLAATAPDGSALTYERLTEPLVELADLE